MLLSPGTILLRPTRKDAGRVTLTDGSILSLGGKSQLQVVKHDAKSQQTELALKYGHVRSEVTALTQPGAKYEVRTPNAVAGVIGTTYTVEYGNGKTRSSMTESGNVSVLALNGGKSATVSQGDEASSMIPALSPSTRVAATVGLQLSRQRHCDRQSVLGRWLRERRSPTSCPDRYPRKARRIEIHSQSKQRGPAGPFLFMRGCSCPGNARATGFLSSSSRPRCSPFITMRSARSSATKRISMLSSSSGAASPRTRFRAQEKHPWSRRGNRGLPRSGRHVFQWRAVTPVSSLNSRFAPASALSPVSLRPAGSSHRNVPRRMAILPHQQNLRRWCCAHRSPSPPRNRYVSLHRAVP